MPFFEGGSATLFSKFTGFLWDKLNLSILWSWLPSDIVTWIGTFIGILFLLAIKRVFVN